jgi:hypothetical protein
MPDETILWKAKVTNIASHGNGYTTIMVEILVDNVIPLKIMSGDDTDKGIVFFHETRSLPYKEGQVVELVMRPANG